MANAGNSIGGRPGTAQHGAKGAGKVEPGERLDEFDIADELKGKNALQGEDQDRNLSERHAVPGATGDTDSIEESSRKLDKHHRAASQNRGKNSRDDK
jgi:hypothetical protein